MDAIGILAAIIVIGFIGFVTYKLIKKSGNKPTVSGGGSGGGSPEVIDEDNDNPRDNIRTPQDYS